MVGFVIAEGHGERRSPCGKCSSKLPLAGLLRNCRASSCPWARLLQAPPAPSCCCPESSFGHAKLTHLLLARINLFLIRGLGDGVPQTVLGSGLRPSSGGCWWDKNWAEPARGGCFLCLPNPPPVTSLVARQVSFRYHCQLYSEWRRTNQKVRLMIPASRSPHPVPHSLLSAKLLKKTADETTV